MNNKAKKFFLFVAMAMISCTAAHAEDKSSDEYASAMRDRTNWKECKAQPARPLPPRKPYDPNAARRAMNIDYANAMRDTANWHTYPAHQPLQPQTINNIKIAKNIKVR